MSRDPNKQVQPADRLLDEVRAAARQEQFLEVVSAEEARARFARHVDLAPLAGATVPLAAALGRVLAGDVLAASDAPPFDRANVDGFAVRAADTAGATDAAPKRLRLNAEVLVCGRAPELTVAPGSATAIATGGVVPRGADRVEAVRRPRVAVLSTGNELVQPGEPLRPAAVYDSNGEILAAAIAEAGGEPVRLGAVADDETMLESALRRALEDCDMVVLSGGTSKGAGDLSHRVVARLGAPGILVHGVALKPGKPLCLAAVAGKPVVVLPGFPTSTIFTFHAFVAPVIRARAGLPPEAARAVDAIVPVRLASELGRQEFVLVALIEGDDGPVAFPSPKGSGAVTAFSQADGFLEVDALSAVVDAGTRARVTLIGEARAPDLVIAGSHCVALDAVLGVLADQGFAARTIAIGSLGGVAAAHRGECDLAPVHLLDPQTGTYNAHLQSPGLTLVRGWERMQGVVHRPGDARFEGRAAADALAAALADPDCLMVNRNAGAGTRVLIDQLLKGARPAGYGNQPRSHNAVAAAVAQGRADWGVAIESVARLYGLGFLPLTPESYDFLLVERLRERPAVQVFLAALGDPAVRARIVALGMRPAEKS